MIKYVREQEQIDFLEKTVKLETLDRVSRDLGYGGVKAYDPGRRGAADISFIAEYVDGLDGLGVMGGGAHSPPGNYKPGNFHSAYRKGGSFDQQAQRQLIFSG